MSKNIIKISLDCPFKELWLLLSLSKEFLHLLYLPKELRQLSLCLI
jgi:hypothetical protein